MHRFVDTVPCLPNGETRLLPSPKNHPEREKSHFIFFFFSFFIENHKNCIYAIVEQVNTLSLTVWYTNRKAENDSKWGNERKVQVILLNKALFYE